MPVSSTHYMHGRSHPNEVDIVIGTSPVASLVPGERRASVNLVVPGLTRRVDVTVQPAAVCQVLAKAATEAGISDSVAAALAREAITEAGWRSDAWLPAQDMPLLAWFGGIGFPLLGAAYDSGATPIDEVPRWAKPALAAPNFSDGATAAFPGKASRPVRRALVEAVRPTSSGQISLGVLALALMGRDVLEPDRLARVLSCERALHPLADLPDPSTLEAAREVISDWGPTRAERILVEAAARPDGLALLMTTVGFARQLGDHGPTGRLPNRLTELHNVYRVLVPSAPEPLPELSRTQLRPARGRGCASAPATSRVEVAPHPVLAPASAARTVNSSDRIEAPARHRVLDGATVRDMTLILPRTAGDLKRWGAVLQNCLADFGSTVVAGRSTVVGIQRAGLLIYAVEITSSGTIRQFNGRANRRPPERDRKAVVATLARRGAIDTANPQNRPWLSGVEL